MKNFFERYKSWHTHDSGPRRDWLIALLSGMMVAVLLAVGVCLALYTSFSDALKSQPYDEAVKEGYTGSKIEYIAALIAEEISSGESAYEIAVKRGYKGTEAEWLMSLTGKDGKDGQDGSSGKSAFDLALENGYVGTLSDWLNSLVGEAGLDGEMGAAGSDGKSAYELAVENGYSGSVTEWLVSLVGANGKDGVDGKDGKSAYDLAVENGYKGSLSEWLSTVASADGKDGKSAYELAVDNGYEGTESQWLASLMGRGVSSIVKGLSEGLVDTYIITYTDGSTSTFTVTNGQNGIDGIDGQPGENGHTPTITINSEGYWCVDGVSTGIKAQGEKGDRGDKGDQGEKGEDGVGVASIVKTETNGTVDTYTITYTDGTTSTFTVTNGQNGIDGIDGQPGEDGHTPTITINSEGYWCVDGVSTGIKAQGEKGDKGDQGEKGEDGRGIASIDKTATSGIVDTYTITYTDGTTFDFYVTNGLNSLGDLDGPSNDIQNNPSVTPSISINDDGYWCIDGVTTDIKARGEDGANGNDGVGISSVIKASTEGLVDTYVIAFTDGTTTTFTVKNGSVISIVDDKWYINGEDTGISAIGATGNGIESVAHTSSEGLVDTYTITFTDGTTTTFKITVAATWHTGNNAPKNIVGARVGDFYIDLLTSDVYELTKRGWENITNIRGISIIGVSVEALYDEKGRYFERYTFKFSDGTEQIVDCYDTNRVHAIVPDEYYVLVSNDPARVPDIELKIIKANSNIEYVHLESFMIMNIHEVNFSTPGTYQAFINYYNVCEYITIHILPEVPVPVDDSYINEPNIIWSEQNFGSFLGLTYTVIYDRPGVATKKLSLTDPDVTITKSNGSPISEIDMGRDLTLYVTYDGHTEILNVYWLSDGTTPGTALLKNAKVESVYYVGDTLHIDAKDITEDGVVYPTLYGYHYLVFDVYTTAFSGKYIREVDFEYDMVLSLDDNTPFGYDNKPSDEKAVDYMLRVCLVPTVTVKTYDITNTITISVNNDAPKDLEEVEALVNFSDIDVLVSSDSVPDVDVTFKLDVYPYEITVPLTLDMLVDKDVFQTEGYKTVELAYRYGNSLLTGSVSNIYVHRLTGVTASGADDDNTIFETSYSRYFVVDPIDDRMKCTRSSDIVPTIYLTATFKRSKESKYVYTPGVGFGWDNPPVYVIETFDIELTRSDIVNLKYLDFSTPGRKKIEFYYNGILRYVYIDFYDVETGIIESIVYSNGNYDQNAIPGTIYFDDIAYLYVNALTNELYDKYSGEWRFVADLSALLPDEVVEYTLGDGNSIWLKQNTGWIGCSFDGQTYYTLVNQDTLRDGEAFVGYGDPHDNVNKDDIMYAIKQVDSMKIGTVIKIRYFEPIDGITEREIVVDESFFDHYDLSMFKEGYVGSQNIVFRFGEHYVVNITVRIDENADRFEQYTTLDEFRNNDNQVIEIWLDTERNIYGTRKVDGNISSFNAYYVAEQLGNGRVVAYLANCSMTELADIINNSADAMRIDVNYLYKIGFTRVIIDYNNKTIEHADDVAEFTEVNLMTLFGNSEDVSGIKAYLRLAGNIAELKLVVEGEGNMVLRFYYKSYDYDTIISMNDTAVAEQFMQVHFVYNDQTGMYDAYQGRWGVKYAIDPSVLGEDGQYISELYFVLCDDNVLSLSYPEMELGTTMEVKYIRISADKIYIPDAGFVVVLDNVNMTGEVYVGDTYDADISDVITALEELNGNKIYVSDAQLVLGYDTITVYLTLFVGEGETRTFTLVYSYYEFAEGKFDIRIIDNDLGLSYDERELINTFYIELVEKVVIDELTGEEIVTYVAVAKSAAPEADNGEGEPTESHVIKYNIDYSEFYSFPDELPASSIREAYITIDPNGSLLSIYINGTLMHEGAYTYDPMLNVFIPDGFYDYDGLTFSFEIIDSDTVKMYDMLPGEKYDLEVEEFFKLMGDEIDAERAFVRFADNGMCSIYVEVLTYDSYEGRYYTERLMIIAYYNWNDGQIVPIDIGDDDMPLCLVLVDSNTYELTYGNEHIQSILFTEDGMGFILYRSGVAACDSSFGLVEFCFWTYLDDNHILMTTVLGFGIIFEINDGVLYYDDEFIKNSNIFEAPASIHLDDSVVLTVYKYKNSDRVIIYYSARETGNGEAITGGYMMGERISDNLYYASYLVFSDLLIQYIGNQCIIPPLALD